LYLFLAILAFRFSLSELHHVINGIWVGNFRMTPQLKRDVKWWTWVPTTKSNGKPIQRTLETTYLHTDNLSYGWGAVLNNYKEARGF
jgi:hypothetical protein